VSRYRLVLADFATRAHTLQSRRLAQAVQRALLKSARQQRPKLADRGVRKAIFYVLMTARVPGVLTEVSFISNREGEAALGKADYQRRLGLGIAQGVLDYAAGR
jgi:N-acetylmuramoyl-L-alanine amidase